MVNTIFSSHRIHFHYKSKLIKKKLRQEHLTDSDFRGFHDEGLLQANFRLFSLILHPGLRWDLCPIWFLILQPPLPPYLYLPYLWVLSIKLARRSPHTHQSTKGAEHFPEGAVSGMVFIFLPLGSEVEPF